MLRHIYSVARTHAAHVGAFWTGRLVSLSVAAFPFTPQYITQRSMPSWRARMHHMLQPLRRLSRAACIEMETSGETFCLDVLLLRHIYSVARPHAAPVGALWSGSLVFFVVAVLPFTPQYTQQRTIPSWRARMQYMLQPVTAEGRRCRRPAPCEGPVWRRGAIVDAEDVGIARERDWRPPCALRRPHD